MTDIGANIQVYRKLKKMTQNDLAEKMHVSRQTISKWELNKSTPTIDYLIQLSQELKVTLDQLITSQKIVEKDRKENIMKKGLLFVQNYTPSNDTTWGNEAKDYGTRDFLANLAHDYPEISWRPVRFNELDAVLAKTQIDFIVVTPAVERLLNQLQEKYSGKIRVLKPNEYAQITLNRILEK
ncbi:helix-turn-helix domain-containing protein [Enterococcus sp. LJL128]